MKTVLLVLLVLSLMGCKEETIEIQDGRILITDSGIQPEEITVSLGDTISIKLAEGKHRLIIGGVLMSVMEEGTVFEHEFDDIGRVRVFDIITKKSVYVNVK